MAILVCLGKPKDDKAIDDDVEAAFKLEKKDRYKRPFLIRYTELVGGAMEYVFYSRWIAIEKWQNPDIESDLLTALDRHKVEETCNGGKKHIIILHLGKGVQALERGVLYDDEV